MHRVVITGLGVVAPNGIGVDAFHRAQSAGISGIRKIEELERLKFRCQVGGIPPITQDVMDTAFSRLEQRMIDASAIKYGVIAGLEAWKDCGMTIPEDHSDPAVGIIFGAGISGVEKFRKAIYQVDDFDVRRLGSTVVINTMTSGVSAFLSGKIGAGNQVTTNSSACVTGTESVSMAFRRIQHGYAKIILAGSCSEDGPYIWGGFDAMRVMNSSSNGEPEKSSRPMSASASGFVPGSGAGALVLENYEHAIRRGATIYAEILGAAENSGGHRNGGSMTAPNGKAVQDCISIALENANIQSSEIDYINGHLTATKKDGFEINNWCEALSLRGNDFPPINSTKSTVGHCLSAAGSIELVACVLQLQHDVMYPSINCDDLHEEVVTCIDEQRVVRKLEHKTLNVIVKASFGFGDVNGCVVLKKI